MTEERMERIFVRVKPDTSHSLRLNDVAALLGVSRAEVRIVLGHKAGHSEHVDGLFLWSLIRLALRYETSVVDRVYTTTRQDRYRRTRSHIPIAVKRAVVARDIGRCRYCAIDLAKTLTAFDHVVPWVSGGGHEVSNIVMACQPCNMQKSGRDPFEASMLLWPAGTLTKDKRSLRRVVSEWNAAAYEAQDFDMIRALVMTTVIDVRESAGSLSGSAKNPLGDGTLRQHQADHIW